MINLVTFFQSTKDGNRIFYCWLIHLNRLETPLQCSILFNVLTVFIQRCGADAVQFASCQHRFQHVSGIHGTVCFSCSDDQMQFIDEQNNFSVTLSDFFQNGFQTLLELAAVFCSGYQCSHIK